MSLDGITLSVIVNELKDLYDAKIERIYQPARDEVTMYLHTRSGKKRLTLSASAADCRIHLTTQTKQNPDKAPNFCMVLRKYLLAGRIAGIVQMGLDRIVHILIDSKDEMGVICRYTLAVEMMGKYSNLILCNQEGIILDSIKHVSLDTSSKRQVLPGLRYVLPPSDKCNPLTASAESLTALLSGQELPGCLMQHLEGISPQTAVQICSRYWDTQIPPVLAATSAPDFVNFVVQQLRDMLDAPLPCLQKDMQGKPVFFSATPYDAYPASHRETFDSANVMLDTFYSLRIYTQQFKNMQDSLLRTLHKHITRLEKKVRIHLETMQGTEKADKFLLHGELLSANLYQIKRGASKAEVYNYYTNEMVTITLDPAVSPSQNATKFFKKASKMKHGATLAKEHYEADNAELTYLRSLEFDTVSAQDTADLSEVRSELIRFGYMSLAPREKLKRSDPLERPRKFITANGYTVLAGRNSRQNDVLTMRIAEEDDLWFHAKNIPGSHVILFTKGTQPPEEDMLQAAILAASLCRVKNSGKIPIDYVKRKYIWKANGAKPGMVLYENYRTAMIEPDMQLVSQLEQQS